MKIEVLGIRGLPSTYSGLETIMGELAPRWVAAGHEVTVHCRRSHFADRSPQWQGIRRVFAPSLEYKGLSTLTHGFVSSIKAALGSADVVLVWNAANGPFGWILRAGGKRAVINVDGMEWLRPKWKGLGRVYFKWAARAATRAFPKVITDAGEMKRRYLAEFGVETRYIAYGANIETSAHPEMLDEYGLRPRDYYLIASRLVPDNNADLIVRSFVATDSTRKLAIAGGADYRGNTTERRFIDRLKHAADDRVLFLGHIDSPDHIKELHLHCYAYIHGHKFGGINPSLLKALGYSNCVLALDTPFNSEVLDGGRYGILFEEDVADLAGRLRDLDADEERAEGYRSRATEPIRDRFNWDRIAGQYLELFDELLGER